MATIKDVARLAGVSPSTASAAMNNSPKVRKEVAARIRAIAREIDYTPSASARALKRGTSGLLGLVVADVSNPFYGEITKAIEQAARALGYAVILSSSGWDVSRERGYLDLMISHRVDGLIVAMTGQESTRTLQRLRNDKVPVVMIDQVLDDLPFDAVTLDNAAAARLAVDHIVAQGHRRIGLIAGPQALATGADRRRGYEAALAAHGIAPDPSIMAEADYTVEAGHVAARRILSASQPPTAVFATSDSLAIGLMRHIAESGLRCPEDVSVVGVDDFPMAGAVLPGLTVVAQPVAEMGRRAVERLAARIAARAADASAPLADRTADAATPSAGARDVFAPILIRRASCQPPAPIAGRARRRRDDLALPTG